MKRYTREEVVEFFKKNNLELLETEYHNTSQKLKYRCLKCDYIGTKVLNSLLSNSGCPSCSGTLKHTYPEVQELFKKSNMELLSKNYKNTQQKLKYRCLKCGYIGTKLLGNLLAGKGCISCAGILKFTHSHVKNMFKEKDMELLSKNYKNNQQKLKCRCLKCGNIEYKSLVALQSGKGCLSCSGTIRYTYKDVKRIFKEKNMKLLSKEYKNIKQKLKYKCLICGYIGEKALRHLSEYSSCKNCGYQRSSDKQKYTYEQVKSFFAKEDLELLSKEYKNCQQRLKYRCLKCGYEGTKNASRIHHDCSWFNMNLTEEDRINRRTRWKYKIWAKKVKEKDNYTCQKCHIRGGGTKFSS